MTQIAGMSTCVWSVRSDRRPHRPRPPESGHSAGAATSKLFDSRLTRVGVTWSKDRIARTRGSNATPQSARHAPAGRRSAWGAGARSINPNSGHAMHRRLRYVVPSGCEECRLRNLHTVRRQFTAHHTHSDFHSIFCAGAVNVPHRWMLPVGTHAAGLVHVVTAPRRNAPRRR